MNKHVAKLNIFACIVVGIIACMLITAQTAFGAVAGAGSLTISYRTNNQPITSASFSVYYIGVKVGETLVLSSAFQGYTGTNQFSDAASMQAVSDELYQYATNRSIKPTATGFTNSNGIITFYGLEDGYYLVADGHATMNNKNYESQPFLLSVPIESNGAYSYDVVAQPKYTETDLTQELPPGQQVDTPITIVTPGDNTGNNYVPVPPQQDDFDRINDVASDVRQSGVANDVVDGGVIFTNSSVSDEKPQIDRELVEATLTSRRNAATGTVLQTGDITAISVACLIGVALIIGIVVLVRRRNSKS